MKESRGTGGISCTDAKAKGRKMFLKSHVRKIRLTSSSTTGPFVFLYLFLRAIPLAPDCLFPPIDKSHRRRQSDLRHLFICFVITGFLLYVSRLRGKREPSPVFVSSLLACVCSGRYVVEEYKYTTRRHERRKKVESHWNS